jgi:uncharacterized protein (PEP-CTERM system associated)
LKVEDIRPGFRPTEARGCGCRVVPRAFVWGAALVAGIVAGGANAESWRIVPYVTLTETYSDNVALIANEFAKPGWITDLAPGIRAEISGARVKGFLDFRLNALAYSSESQLNTVQPFLNAIGKVEAVENLFFVDARADINQQNRSPFGASSTPGVVTPSLNAVQTSSLQISPYLRGRVSDIANYQLRFIATGVRADDVFVPNTNTTQWLGRIGSASPSAKLGWALDATTLSLRNDVVGTLDDSRVWGSLTYAINPQLHVTAIAGYENTDFAGPPKRGNDTPGVGLAWTPSERTQFSGVYERRFFGDGYSALFSYRTPLSAWKIVTVKDVEALPTQLATGSLVTIAGLMSQLLTSAIPDPEEREAAVRRRLEEIGITGNSALSSSAYTVRPFIYWNTAASAVLLGTTNTVTLTYSNREQRGFGVSLSSGKVVLDDDFRKKGFNVNWVHKLSPLTSLTLLATTLQTKGLTITALKTRQDSASLFLSSQIGPRTSTSIGVRFLDFSSSVAFTSYRENAIFGTLSIRL